MYRGLGGLGLNIGFRGLGSFWVVNRVWCFGGLGLNIGFRVRGLCTTEIKVGGWTSFCATNHPEARNWLPNAVCLVL